MTLRLGSLCSGYGGLEEGVRAVLGGDVAWHSEIDSGAVKILNHRYPGVPNLGDMTAVDWSQVEPVDVITGGTPCQDVSAAGKRAGMRAGTRSGLWASMCDAIDIIRPSLVVWENVRGVLSAGADSNLESRAGRMGDGGDGPVLRALGRVLGDLADIGYDASWQGLRAADVGAPHGRFRVFVTAWPAADARGGELQRRRVGGVLGSSAATEPREGDQRQRAGHAAGDGRSTPADAEGDGWNEGWAEPAGLLGGSDDAVGGAPAGVAAAPHSYLSGLEGAEPAAGRELSARGTDPDAARFGRRPAGRDDRVRSTGLVKVDWGQYGPAVRRWEQLTRPAPSPTELSAKGSPRLSPAFVEWMQGLPAGWVTDVPGLTRNEQLKALGNGVVPQQAAQALRLLLIGSPAAMSADARPLLQTPLTTTATGVQQLERQVGGRGSRGVA